MHSLLFLLLTVSALGNTVSDCEKQWRIQVPDDQTSWYIQWLQWHTQTVKLTELTKYARHCPYTKTKLLQHVDVLLQNNADTKNYWTALVRTAYWANTKNTMAENDIIACIGKLHPSSCQVLDGLTDELCQSWLELKCQWLLGTTSDLELLTFYNTKWRRQITQYRFLSWKQQNCIDTRIDEEHSEFEAEITEHSSLINIHWSRMLETTFNWWSWLRKRSNATMTTKEEDSEISSLSTTLAMELNDSMQVVNV
jgi:hypothetical protein